MLVQLCFVLFFSPVSLNVEANYSGGGGEVMERESCVW